MARLRTIAEAMKDRIETIPELAGMVVVFGRGDIESEFEKRMRKARGRCVVIRIYRAKNDGAKRRTGYYRATYTVTLFMAPLLTQKDVKAMEDLEAEIEHKIHGWWPPTVPHNGNARLEVDDITYPDDPDYAVSRLLVMTAPVPLNPVGVDYDAWENQVTKWENL